MENLIIKATSKTPEVEFLSGGRILIRGRSIPEDANIFFDPLQSWVIQYCKSPSKNTIVDMELDYMNSGSAKSLLKLLNRLAGLTNHGNSLTINWHYEEGDEDMIEKGEYFEDILRVKFHYIES